MLIGLRWACVFSVVVLLVMNIVVAAQHAAEKSKVHTRYHETWTVDEIHKCANYTDGTTQCNVVLTSDQTDTSLPSVKLHFMVEEEDKVYRNCFYRGDKRKCYSGFSSSVAMNHHVPFDEAKPNE